MDLPIDNDDFHSYVSLPEGKWDEPPSTNKMEFVIDPDELQPHTETSLECWLVETIPK